MSELPSSGLSTDILWGSVLGLLSYSCINRKLTCSYSSTAEAACFSLQSCWKMNCCLVWSSVLNALSPLARWWSGIHKIQCLIFCLRFENFYYHNQDWSGAAQVVLVGSPISAVDVWSCERQFGSRSLHWLSAFKWLFFSKLWEECWQLETYSISELGHLLGFFDPYHDLCMGASGLQRVTWLGFCLGLV